MDWERQCAILQKRIDELESENQELRRRLGMPAKCAEESAAIPASGIHKYSSPAEKIKLFRSLFRGREDVYAKRWYSTKSEKSGYSPVCANEWREGVCLKPKGSCSKCEHRSNVPISDSVLYAHLSGKDSFCRDVVGIYPIMSDDTCTFLAIDFDDGDWQENVTAVRNVCTTWNVPCSVERSRSGDGAHLWIFFKEPISCPTVRKLGSSLLTSAMEQGGKLKLDSYDRMFPCQDTLPNGGFGNLIALPLQGLARKRGNSVFVDENFMPFSDQWSYLASVKKVNLPEVEAILKQHSHGDPLGKLCEVEPKKKPWERENNTILSAMDFLGVHKIVRSNFLYIPSDELTPKVRNRLLRLAAFKNPEFYKAQAMRLPIYDKPRIICTAQERDGYLALPRGCEAEMLQLFENAGTTCEIEDQTNPGKSIHVEFNGQLRDEQQPAADSLLEHNNGVLSATTAFGKTVVAAYLIGHRKVNTLILVHTQALMNQWKKSLESFLTINEILPGQPKRRGRKKERSLIGQLGGTKESLSGIVDIAIMQSLISGDDVRELVKDYGMVIVDECHHVSALSFERVFQEVTARYVYGLTATPIRQDGHHPIIYMQCGPIRYQVDAKAQAEKRSFDHAVLPRFTAFSQPLDVPKAWAITDAYAAITKDSIRNEQIVADVLEAVESRRTPLVLTERFDHAKLLADQLSQAIPNTALLSGKGSAKEKRELLQHISEISSEEKLVLVATGRYVGEGFDMPRLDTLFLAMPVSWKGTLAQYAGRLHRDYAGKQEVLIYDYIDARVPMLEKMYQRRLNGYAAIGYSIRGDRAAPVGENRIFSQEEYWVAFSADIQATKKEIIVVCPYLHIGQVKAFVRILPQKVKVTVITGEEDNFKPETWQKMSATIAYLQENGIRVENKPDIYQRFAVIDQELLWYGGVNFLGFEKNGNGTMRLHSPELSMELIASIIKEQECRKSKQQTAFYRVL